MKKQPKENQPIDSPIQGQIYHVTPERNLNSILGSGLLPQCGPRSVKRGETVPRVYFYPTLEAVEAALTDWLGDAFADEVGAIVVLEIDAADLTLESGADFDHASQQPIPADKIRLSFVHN